MCSGSEEIGRVPFPLFAPSEPLRGPRQIAGVGRSFDTIETVALDHGEADSDEEPWLRVAVTGPLHDPTPAKRWSMDPRPMIASELLNAAGAAWSAPGARTDCGGPA